eukprot:SAG22_NODE_9250_length_600_cov_2.696607_2_plen_61_part_01
MYSPAARPCGSSKSASKVEVLAGTEVTSTAAAAAAPACPAAAAFGVSRSWAVAGARVGLSR